MQPVDRADSSPPDPSRFSRRERQIMDLLFACGEATVNEVCAALPDPPTPMAVRRMLHILEDKGHLKRRTAGREIVYAPRATKGKAGRTALEGVLQTFFGGSLEEALAAHLFSRKNRPSRQECARLMKLIAQARKEGR